MKKDIIFIYPDLYVGGIQTLIYRKARWLIDKGFKITLITSSKGNMHKSFEKLGVSLLISDTIFSSTTLILEVTNLVCELSTTVMDLEGILVIECFEPINSPLGIILSKLINTKFITGVYHPKAYCTGFELEYQKFDKLLMLLDKYNSIIFMNEDVLKSHQKFYDLEIKNKNILFLPVDIKKERNNVLISKEFKIISVGRLVDFKKYVYGLINDFDEFYKTNTNSKLIIIGDGNEKNKIIKYAKKLKSYKAGKVIFLGTLPYNELDKYVQEASMVVGMGTSLLEMASMSIPAIIAPAYEKNNISNGLIFEDDNVGDIKNSCKNTYKYYMDILYDYNQDELYDIGKKCRDYVIEKYSTDKIMNQWLEIVELSKPIILIQELDYVVGNTPFREFVSFEKTKIKVMIKNFLNK